ncbi:MAG: gluconate 2-dehydrogenase subunit 3 family protein [Alphaproteobacteria bacterium]|nr:gluconate 2-dehydrogenase subunit 3 family protein [Alphaproteobacteria bacterium]MBV8409804.1 gluconate 2-dehydrogenase subunit 3 family protein [Alphaproteobacteria bacterium]
MAEMSRRILLKTGVGAAALPAAGVAASGQTAQGQTTGKPPEHSAGSASTKVVPRNEIPTVTYLFFNSEEAAFVEAAVARLIPADEEWGGALEAGVPNYIDKQLAGAWGAGERLYRSGPWHPGTPGQGYQLPFTPAELFRMAIGALNKDLTRRGTTLAKMTPEQQDDFLRQLESGTESLEGVPANVFFAQLWEVTLEGFFSDPVYGGNRDMLSWRMIGFPGAYASYYEVVDQHGIKIDRAPMSLGEDVHGHVHLQPAIPATSP